MDLVGIGGVEDNIYQGKYQLDAADVHLLWDRAGFQTLLDVQSVHAFKVARERQSI